MGPHGFFRITCCSPRVSIANPRANVDVLLDVLSDRTDSDVMLFPELALSGYTCGDLFASDTLLDTCQRELQRLATETRTLSTAIVVGCPILAGDQLFNAAVVLQRGIIRGLVPKRFLPNYREFYEARWFRAADSSQPSMLQFAGTPVPFGSDLLFTMGSATLGIEVCEDLWTPIPPSSRQAMAGANVLLNLSASNEVIGKPAWRRDLIRSQSGRCLAAYAYASAGPSESTTDLVFSGHCLIAENGHLLKEASGLSAFGIGRSPGSQSNSRQSSQSPPGTHAVVTADVDLQHLQHDRQVQNSFSDPSESRAFRTVILDPDPPVTATQWTLTRTIDPHPFVPGRAQDLEARCAEILEMQVAGLAKRLSRLPTDLPLTIGVSGGLDSTLALLVACQACDAMGYSRRRIEGFSLPGFGTSQSTRANAEQLIDQLNVTPVTVDIRPLCLQTFRDLGHQPFGIDLTDRSVDHLQDALTAVPTDASDLVFENVQARVRTMLLMNRGFVLGTGDLSEQALGWSTYNADHMSMYNVNTSIPKTLVRFLVRYFAQHRADDSLREVLLAVVDTPISPELLPLGQEGAIRQSTEATLGPYELHDFFLYHFVRFGASRDKIRYLAGQAEFSRPFGEQDISTALDRFFERFFANQFKRSCVPDGPKVGTVSLSPRGDWRMPSDASDEAF